MMRGGVLSGSFAIIYSNTARQVTPQKAQSSISIHNQEEIVYDHVFVRVVSGSDSVVVVWRNRSRAAAPTSIAIADAIRISIT